MTSRYATSAAKRVTERLVAAGILALLSPIVLACALAVLSLDGRPAFFIDTRVGRHGKLFGLIKFRSMRLEPGLPITAGGDARITPIGARLRKWKLDELPQLWNVVRGDMSLVGPRPEHPAFVDVASPDWAAILQVAPGITGAASVEYVNEDERLSGASNPVQKYLEEILPVKLAIDLAWLETCSPMVDLRLLARTFAKVTARW